ncbi:hypothetical protein CLAFUW4_00764 [Fulvia fulva]|uniref:Protein BFR2 n=1 Tax=Passalora fulva TaxID=5499 RepID=A0A9Q8P392_PASFU|nr:uncharacterized protein CLAFUR5_00767 [Fulvia fulva]KAK4635867.1 hypothetical protein CLAFUR4_00765 [Fulvia fulva]KAK4637092.1 hypothetical protein CLAFUR0_00766 [Fulvia fulva]UJO11775.1 hypothetical protein CLAFUR5_00767 [Fulvia fulva]WPV09596.1 hypothetical protein CLAFUW4_00764 [Fulvia fulva]WPV23616.1 hypothetical protein CLAFUW7_00769 [Fulvia fulva]
MAPNRGRNRQSEFEEYAATTAKDFDPEEDNLPANDDDDSGSEGIGDEFNGREHYEHVEKSKLRNPKVAPLGPQYRGAKVGRHALDEHEEDDPFSHAFEDEDSGEEDVAMEDEDGSEDSEDMDDDLANATDATDLSEEEDEGDEEEQQQSTAKISPKDLEDLKKVRGEDAQKDVAKSLAQSNREEAEKGRAVKKQRTTFDSLLNARMKLQKSLVATNTLVGTPADEIEAERSDAQHALKAAETAAFSLWSSLNSLREDLIEARTGEKRKRSHFTASSSTNDLWGHLQAQENQSRPARDAVLKKWSNKAQGPTVQTQSGRINRTEHQATIIDVLQEQLSNTDRLMKRAHAPKSCAPLQLSRRVSEDDKIYDDADFYGILLKELLEQKSADSVAASNIDLGYQVRREAKTKRNVDTKASKGRKLRYTVHEKLQNFMAPEDRTVWTESRADALFPSLFEQNMGLMEKDDDDDRDVDGDDGSVDGALRLF